MSLFDFPETERLLSSANGVAVTVNDAHRLTVWVQHPGGHWTEHKFRVARSGESEERAAERLHAEVLGEIVSKTPWKSDEDFLQTSAPAFTPMVVQDGWGPVAAEAAVEAGWEREAAARETSVQRQRVYLAGPMRGIPGFNFPAFFAAETALTALGFEVFNPARYDVEQMGFQYEGLTGTEDLAELGFDLRHTLSKDMEFITQQADAVAVMPGWQTSKGATAEVATARAIGLLILDASTGRDLDEPPAAADTGQVDTAHGEVRTTSSTGGQKGVKRARFDLIPVRPLTRLAEHYGRGADKYDAHQWRQGYEWSKSYAALQRHLTAWWNGEDIDPDPSMGGAHHLDAVMWHAFCLVEMSERFPTHDDRYRPGE